MPRRILNLLQLNTFGQPRAERGATAVEYGLMVGLIAAVIIGGVVAFGLAVDGLFGRIPSELFTP